LAGQLGGLLGAARRAVWGLHRWLFGALFEGPSGEGILGINWGIILVICGSQMLHEKAAQISQNFFQKAPQTATQASAIHPIKQTPHQAHKFPPLARVPPASFATHPLSQFPDTTGDTPSVSSVQSDAKPALNHPKLAPKGSSPHPTPGTLRHTPLQRPAGGNMRATEGGRRATGRAFSHSMAAVETCVLAWRGGRGEWWRVFPGWFGLLEGLNF
jgi:hypothetical protein